MTRASMRAAVASALSGAGFDLIVQGAPESCGGKANVAVITSAGSERRQLARAISDDAHRITVSIYVQRAANGGAAAEAALDAFSAATIAAIDALSPTIVFAASDAGAQGAPNRRIDGQMYRLERIVFTIVNDV